MGKLLNKLLCRREELLSKLTVVNAEIEKYQSNPELEAEQMHINKGKKLDHAIDDFCELIDDYDLVPILKNYLISHKHISETGPEDYRPREYDIYDFKFKDIQVHINITFNGENEVEADIFVSSHHGYIQGPMVYTLKGSLDLPENVHQDYTTILTKLYNADLKSIERFM